MDTASVTQLGGWAILGSRTGVGTPLASHTVVGTLMVSQHRVQAGERMMLKVCIRGPQMKKGKFKYHLLK